MTIKYGGVLLNNECLNKITDFQSLHKAYKRSRKGKAYKLSSLRFASKALEGIHLIRHELLLDKYKVSPYFEFYVTKPKKREIKACRFKDKVVQHVLCDEIITPKLESLLCDYTYGSRINKGSKAARQAFRHDLMDAYEFYGDRTYILKCDIHKYFYSIDHELLKGFVKKYFEGCYDLCCQFIDSVESPGIPLGNQISQCFANLYLNNLDWIILNKLKCKWYGRYMDDFYLIGSKDYLRECLIEIRKYVKTLKLELNPKTQIFPIRRGVPWVGFNYKILSGNLIVRVSNSKKREVFRKYKALTRDYVRGDITYKELKTSWQSWVNYVTSEGCVGIVYALKKYMREVFRNEIRKIY